MLYTYLVHILFEMTLHKEVGRYLFKYLLLTFNSFYFEEYSKGDSISYKHKKFALYHINSLFYTLLIIVS